MKVELELLTFMETRTLLQVAPKIRTFLFGISGTEKSSANFKGTGKKSVDLNGLQMAITWLLEAMTIGLVFGIFA